MTSKTTKPTYEEVTSVATYEDYGKLKDATLSSADQVDRYTPISQRSDESWVTEHVVKNLCKGKYLTGWRGADVMKDPLDLIIYQTLMAELRPASVIEIGAYRGGTAMWMADVLACAEVPAARVYSMDLELSLLDPRARSHDNVSFIEGDCNHIEAAFPPAMLKDLPHPWLFVEDAHVNLTGMLEYFHQHFQPGDYLIIDDTHPLSPTSLGSWRVDEYQPFGDEKLVEMKNFLLKHDKDYAIDTKFNDMFGYNGSMNINGYIRRM